MWPPDSPNGGSGTSGNENERIKEFIQPRKNARCQMVPLLLHVPKRLGDEYPNLTVHCERGHVDNFLCQDELNWLCLPEFALRYGRILLISIPSTILFWVRSRQI